MRGGHSNRSPAYAACAIVIGLSLALPATANDVGDSSGADFAVAQDAARHGDYELALQQYAALMLREPNNVDFIFGYSQVLFWSGDTARALQFLEQARKLAPDYEDLRAFEERVRESAARPPPRTFLWELDGGVDSLSNSTDWEQFGIRVGRVFPARITVNLSAYRYSRFDTSDSQFGIDSTFEIGTDWIAYAAYSTSSSTNFTPRNGAELSLSRRFASGWVSGVRVRRRDYEDTAVDSFALLLERYFSRYRIAYVAEVASISSERALGNALTFNVYPRAGHSLGVIIAYGEEIDFISPGQLLEMDVTSITLIGRHPINSHLDIGWRLGTHEQGQFYRRNSFGLTLSGGF